MTMGLDKKNKILRYMLDPILARNKQFVGCHQGGTCYIVGNGASLKNMDLSVFSDHPAIGLNLLCIHNEFRSLDIKYHMVVEPFFLYPLITNTYTKKRFQPNILGNLFKKAFFPHSDIPLFTSISNIFGAKFDNTFYLHHFGIKAPSKEHLNICGEFGFMNGALYGGVGLAINMGFKKAYLLGCDHLMTPRKAGHFYTYGPPIIHQEYESKSIHDALLKEVDGLIELCVITDTGKSQWLPSQDYMQFKNENIEYRENSEIVAPEYLAMLDRAVEFEQLANKIRCPAI